MVQFAQGLDLPQFDALVPTLVFLLHLLDRHHLPRLDVGRLVHSPKGPVPQRLYRLVFLHLTNYQ